MLYNVFVYTNSESLDLGENEWLIVERCPFCICETGSRGQVKISNSLF